MAVTVAKSISCLSQQDQVAEVKHHPDTPLHVLSLGQFRLCIGPSPPCRVGLTMSDGKKASLSCSRLRTQCPFLITEIQIQVLPQVPSVNPQFHYISNLAGVELDVITTQS